MGTGPEGDGPRLSVVHIVCTEDAKISLFYVLLLHGLFFSLYLPQNLKQIESTSLAFKI